MKIKCYSEANLMMEMTGFESFSFCFYNITLFRSDLAKMNERISSYNTYSSTLGRFLHSHPLFGPLVKAVKT